MDIGEIPTDEATEASDTQPATAAAADARSGKSAAATQWITLATIPDLA